MPRPTRLAALTRPGAGFNVFNRISSDLLHLHHILDLAHHSSHSGGVFNHYRMANAPKTEPDQAILVALQTAVPALGLHDFQLVGHCHLPLVMPVSALNFASAGSSASAGRSATIPVLLELGTVRQPNISATLLPRRAAT